MHRLFLRSFMLHSAAFIYCLHATKKQQRKEFMLCHTFSADIRLIDDFVPLQSIMHNLTWIKSHINIITHWIFCIV